VAGESADGTTGIAPGDLSPVFAKKAAYQAFSGSIRANKGACTRRFCAILRKAPKLADWMVDDLVTSELVSRRGYLLKQARSGNIAESTAVPGSTCAESQVFT
jgi:hypothetical protein